MVRTRYLRRSPLALLALIALVACVLLPAGCGHPGSEEARNPAPETTPTSTTSTTMPVDAIPMTTSAAWAYRSQEALRVGQALGDAMLAYFAGEKDLATVQGLVEPSAQDGLAQMISVLSEPASREITTTSGSDSSPVVETTLRFTLADGQTRTFVLTVVAETDGTTITAIEPAAPTPGP
jgi:hypothetical protein